MVSVCSEGDLSEISVTACRSVLQALVYAGILISPLEESCRKARLLFIYLRERESNTLKQRGPCARAKSTHKGVNWRSKNVTQTQQQRPESPTSKYKVDKLHQRYSDSHLACE